MPGHEVDISPVHRSKAQARATYDRISRYYDALEGNWEARARSEGLTMLAAGDGESILEIGGGSGHSAITLAKRVGAAGRVYDLDLSPGMLDIVKARARQHQLLDRVLLTCGDAAYLPFAGGCFDAVFMSFVLELFDTPEIAIVLAECRRVLRAGGRLCVVAMSRTYGLNLMGKLYEWGHRCFPSLLDCRPIPVQQILTQAGFEILDASFLSLWGFAVEVALCTACRCTCFQGKREQLPVDATR